jgi:glutathione synthase/RimK-type ligase-like ATP-grasp enzyme
LVGASAGKGIVIADSPHALVEAPLYTQYINKVTEYRVHVFNGKVFHVQEKRKKEDFKNHNELVCNHDNGWVFCIKNVNPSDDVLNAAIAAVSALGMDFGAVDIMVDGDGNPYVLEVNSSPGQEGTTINKYVEMFKEVM